MHVVLSVVPSVVPSVVQSLVPSVVPSVVLNMSLRHFYLNLNLKDLFLSQCVRTNDGMYVQSSVSAGLTRGSVFYEDKYID